MVNQTISETKIRELRAQGTAGSTILATTALSIALIIAQHSAFSAGNEESRIRSGGTSSTASKQASLQFNEKDLLPHEKRSIILGWRQALSDQLADVCQEASVPGWDGYDAEPIKASAVETARHLIALMPETIPHPDVVPSPNGEIAFEWDRGKDLLFSIRTHGELLVYAGLFGSNRKQHGQEPIDQELPQSISTILATYFS